MTFDHLSAAIARRGQSCNMLVIGQENGVAVDFAGQVAIVTGAGRGLGRSHAHMLAARGAKLIINDLGQDAQLVANEIIAAGGEAIAHCASVTDVAEMREMAARAMDQWGRIDVLINNAGILRDKSFAKMDLDDFRLVLDVHLMGSVVPTQAVWEVMRTQNYGRILMTTSGSGLFGNFGQANYSAAKMGLVGLAKTLSLEGARHDIRVNVLAPVAATPMLASVMPEELMRRFDPEDVSALALYLVSRQGPQGMICGAGGGAYHAAYMVLTEGVALPKAERTPEGVAAAFARIRERRGESVPQSGSDQSALILRKLEEIAER